MILKSNLELTSSWRQGRQYFGLPMNSPGFLSIKQLGDSHIVLPHGRFAELFSYCSPSLPVSKRVRTVSDSVEVTKEVMKYTLCCLGFIMLCKPIIQIPLCSVLSVFSPLLQVKEIAQVLELSLFKRRCACRATIKCANWDWEKNDTQGFRSSGDLLSTLL